MLEKNGTSLPSFYAKGCPTLRPASDFYAIASVVCTFRDEVSPMRVQVTELRQAMQRDLKSFEGVNCVIQDVVEIKTILNRKFPAAIHERYTSSDQIRSSDTRVID